MQNFIKTFTQQLHWCLLAGLQISGLCNVETKQRVLTRSFEHGIKRDSSEDITHTKFSQGQRRILNPVKYLRRSFLRI